MPTYAHKHINRSWIAFATESTVCQPPADWAATGTNFEHLGVDVSGVKQALIVDPTMETRAKAPGRRHMIKGVRGVDWNFRAKLHGVGAATVEDAQVDETYLATLLQWVFGGLHRSYTREVISSADAVTLTVGAGLTTGFAVGCLVAVEDVSAAAGSQYDGKPIIRQVATVDAGTDTITLTEALPFTPAAGDIIHATITIYVDETYLEDAVRGGAIRTKSFLHKRTRGDTNTLFQLVGTVASVAFGNLAKGQVPDLTFNCMSGNFQHSGEDSLTEPTFASIEGSPQLSNGPDILCSIAPFGGTTTSLCDVRECAFESGVTRTREEANTETSDDFEGMATYGVTFAESKFNLTLSGYSPTWYGDLATNDEWRMYITQPGPGTGGGKGWAIWMPRARLVATPSLVNGTATLSTQLEFAAMLPDLADTEMGTSPFLIGLF